MDKVTLKKQGWLLNIKIVSMVTPIIMAAITGIAFVVIIYQVFQRNIELKIVYSAGVTAGLSIVTISLTVWVGLNIYTVIEKMQVDNLDRKVKEMTVSTDDLLKKSSGNSCNKTSQGQDERLFGKP